MVILFWRSFFSSFLSVSRPRPAPVFHFPKISSQNERCKFSGSFFGLVCWWAGLAGIGQGFFQHSDKGEGVGEAVQREIHPGIGQAQAAHQQIGAAESATSVRCG